MSKFSHRPDGMIIIDDEFFELSLLQKVFPEYSLPPDMDRRKYTQGESHFVSNGGGVFHLEVPWHLGDKIINKLNDLKQVRSFMEEQEKQEEEESKQLEFQFKPYQEKRKSEYPPIEDLVVAMWEYIVEGREMGKDELQVLRNEIKRKYPKKDV